MQLRRQTGKWIKEVAQWLPFGGLNRVSKGRLIAPFYHAVSDEPLPHIRRLYPVKTLRAFESDLDFLLKYYRPVDLHECRKWQERPGEWKSKPPMLLSFDDGLRSFFDPVAPLLLRKGIPAICFVNSAFLDNADLFYRYKACLLAERLSAENRVIETDQVLAVPYEKRHVLDEQAAALGLDFSDFLRQNQPYLTGSQVEWLLQKGFYIGAHSVDHPEYRKLPLEEQLRQTTACMEYLYNRFALGYRLFSFPFTDFGVSKRFFEILLTEKKIVEYSFGCAGLKSDMHPHHFQRIPMEQGDWNAEEIMRKELLYFWLKMPFGKNKIHRT